MQCIAGPGEVCQVHIRQNLRIAIGHAWRFEVGGIWYDTWADLDATSLSDEPEVRS